MYGFYLKEGALSQIRYLFGYFHKLSLIFELAHLSGRTPFLIKEFVSGLVLCFSFGNFVDYLPVLRTLECR